MRKKATPQKATKSTNAKRQRDLGPPAEAFEGLDAWAAEVATCISKAELPALLGIYRGIANDRRVSADNRRLARKQAQALRKFVY